MSVLKKISVIIVTYNCMEQIVECLNSIDIYNDIGEELEVIVVDNSPSDYIYEFLKKEYPNIITVKSKNNGFGAGNNTGFIHSSGEYLLFLNPDTILVEPIFEYAIKKFESDDLLGIFGIKLVNRKMEENSSFGIKVHYGLLNRFIIKLFRKLQYFLPSIMYTSGADMFIRKTTFEKCGKFDENIFLYGEESDICNRISAQKEKIKYFKDKKMIHLQGQSTGINFEKNFQEMLKSYKYLCLKYNLDYLKILKKELRYHKLRKTIRIDCNLKLHNRIIEMLNFEISIWGQRCENNKA